MTVYELEGLDDGISSTHIPQTSHNQSQTQYMIQIHGVTFIPNIARGLKYFLGEGEIPKLSSPNLYQDFPEHYKSPKYSIYMYYHD